MTSDTRKIARDAAVSSLAANAVYAVMVLAVAVAITRKDWLARTAARARAALSREHRHWRAAREVADFRADVSRWEHDGGCGC